jgi:hypothetical protein
MRFLGRPLSISFLTTVLVSELVGSKEPSNLLNPLTPADDFDL